MTATRYGISVVLEDSNEPREGLHAGRHIYGAGRNMCLLTPGWYPIHCEGISRGLHAYPALLRPSDPGFSYRSAALTRAESQVASRPPLKQVDCLGHSIQAASGCNNAEIRRAGFVTLSDAKPATASACPTFTAMALASR